MKTVRQASHWLSYTLRLSLKITKGSWFYQIIESNGDPLLKDFQYFQGHILKYKAFLFSFFFFFYLQLQFTREQTQGVKEALSGWSPEWMCCWHELPMSRTPQPTEWPTLHASGWARLTGKRQPFPFWSTSRCWHCVQKCPSVLSLPRCLWPEICSTM